MDKSENVEGTDKEIGTLIVEGDNESRTVSVKEVVRMMQEKETEEIAEKSVSFIDNDGNGLALIELHPEKGLHLASVENPGDEDQLTVIFDIDAESVVQAWLKPGRYYLAQNMTIKCGPGDDMAKRITSACHDGFGLLLATDESQVAGPGVMLDKLTLEATGGKFGDSLELWALRKTVSGGYVSLKDLVNGLMLDATLRAIAKRIEEARGEDKSAQANSITTETIRSVYFPIDKVTEHVYGTWSGATPEQLEGMLSADGRRAEMLINLANSADRKQGIQRAAQLKLNWDELPEEVTITGRNKLNEYDKRVHEAFLSLYYGTDGRTLYSSTEVYHAMGGTSKPSSYTLKKINDSITRLMKTSIEVDNASEAEAYTKYEHFKYDGALLPAERIAGYVDGQPTDSLIRLFREPPLATFARGRKQISSCSLKVLQTPVSKTETNMRIEDYMRGQISWMKNGNKNGNKRNRKMTYAAIFKAGEVDSRQAKARKKKDIAKILDSWRESGFIRGYSEGEDGITIRL
jgi:hypothetical protein